MAEPQPCIFCEGLVQLPNVMTELPCHRFLHTACFTTLIRLGNAWTHFDECQDCQTLLPAAEPDDAESVVSHHSNHSVNVSRRERLRNLYDTNEQFRKKTRELAKLKSSYTGAKTRAMKVMRAKKNEIRNQLLVIRAQLQGLLEGKRDEFRATPEYKELLRSKRKYTAYDNSIRTQFNCTSLDITQYLNDKPGLRRFSPLRRWHDSTYRLMHRPWYYRIPI